MIQGKLSDDCTVFNRAEFMVKFLVLFPKIMLVLELLFMICFILVFLLPNGILLWFLLDPVISA